MIDKGIPTAGLLARVMSAKLADYLPLYQQLRVFGRAGLPINRSTLAQRVGQTGVRLQSLVDALRDAALARVISVFDAAKPHCADLFANRRATHMKVLAQDGIDVWLAARRLNLGKFH